MHVGTHRRTFLKQAAGATAVVAVLFFVCPLPTAHFFANTRR
jgi:hypothetical protein